MKEQMAERPQQTVLSHRRDLRKERNGDAPKVSANSHPPLDRYGQSPHH